MTHRTLAPLNPIVTYSMLIGGAFRRYRRALGIEQGGIARATGILQSAISKMERGQTPFTVSNLSAAVQQLNALSDRPFGTLGLDGSRCLDPAIVDSPVSPIEVLQLAQVAAINCARDGVTVLFTKPSQIKSFQTVRVLGRDAIGLRLDHAYREIQDLIRDRADCAGWVNPLPIGHEL